MEKGKEFDKNGELKYEGWIFIWKKKKIKYIWLYNFITFLSINILVILNIYLWN